MKARRIEGPVYRVKTTHGGFLVEVPAGEDMTGELARFCASLTMRGHIISSVTRVLNVDTATPRVSVLTTKEYRDEIKRLTKKEN